MPLLDHSQFISRLTDLFESTRTKGSVWLTCKRLTYDGQSTEIEHSEDGKDTKYYSCVLRASSGSKASKISTRIQPGELTQFHAIYGTLLKSSMGTLRKRDKKRERQKAEAAALHKKRLKEHIDIKGPKRGNGRRKRQRLINAQKKQAAANKREDEKEKERSRARVAVHNEGG